MLDMMGIAVSSGSACSAGAIEPSHVLQAIGLPLQEAQSSIRISLGRSTTKEDLDYVLDQLPPIVERFRSMSPLVR